MFGIYENLPRDDAEFEKHLNALIRLRADPKYKDVFDHLYDCLSILDAKSASLLAFNALVLVIYTINFTQFGQYSDLSHLFLYAGIGALAVSAVLLLRILWVRWSDLDILDTSDSGEDVEASAVSAVTAAPAAIDEPTEQRSPWQHALELIKVRARRTVRYRIAWWFSIAALALMLFFVASAALGVSASS